MRLSPGAGWVRCRRALLALVLMAAGISASAEESRSIRLAVGGQALFYYLPLTLAERLGYFREAGLEVEIIDFPGGSKSLQALMGGSAEVVAGSFEHVVNMRARGQAVTAFVLLARYPAIVLAVGAEFSPAYKETRDLAGRRIGITAPGSSTHLFLNNVLARAGMSPDDVSVIGVGTGASAVAALRRGDVEALVHLDPVIEELVSAGAARVVIDTRTEADARAVYGGAYPAACLYARAEWLADNAEAASALAKAQVRALHWLASASAKDIRAVLPEAFWSRNPAAWESALSKNRAIWSLDGRLDEAGARNVIATLAAFEDFVRVARLEPASLIDTRVVGAMDPE
jgi:NitT/TauT family transport system substrate-binding protein